jgi:branched-chain amino acid transport system ATP-binding protein
MLRVENLDVAYGDLQVLWDVSLQVEPGSTVAVVGPNGAGKTTALKTIAGLMRPSRGQIHFNGTRIDAHPPHQIVNSGISLVPEWKGIFTSLSVRKNLKLGAYPSKARPHHDQNLQEVFQIFPILNERQDQQASTLSGGERQMLGIGRALMSRPSLLILDEPSLGLAPLVVEHIFEVLRRINGQGVSILLVEQNIRLALEMSDHAYILENGRIAGQGAGERLLSDDRVREAYLGI